ncbi:MAG: patatin-like phospholipase family protein [Thermodesulfobacteriota bacterium]|nr:patatin-like phospholipase family protein [Thermodesulfobacteriota bacterium]
MAGIFHKRGKIPQGKVGIALGSGSSKGWAHIGAIKALTEAGIHIDYIAGTSIGAVVGAAYASGKIAILEDVVLQLDWKQIVYLLDVVFPKSGMIDGNKIAEFIRSQVGAKLIEELPLPFAAVSTDLATGREVVIKEGDIIEAVRASISVPGIFTPISKEDMILLDGGLVNPVPVSVVRNMGADFVIAVDLNHDIVSKKGIGKSSIPGSVSCPAETEDGRNSEKGNRILRALNARFKPIDFSDFSIKKHWMSKDPIPNIFEVLLSSINIMEAQITATRLKTDPPDILIQPPLGHIRFLEFNRAGEAIASGYEETKSRIDLFSKGTSWKIFPGK